MLQRLSQCRVALLKFFKQSTFSMAIAAWSANVLSNDICFSAKGRISVRRRPITPMATPSRNKGAATIVRISRPKTLSARKLRLLHAWKSSMWIELTVNHCASFTDSPV